MKNLQQALNTYRTVVIFVTLVLLITVIFGAIFGTGQQVLRGDSDYPQVEVVQQVQGIIEQGVPLDVIVNSEEAINLEESMSLFVMIFDKDKNLVSSSAKIGEQSPTPPSESFDIAKSKGENKFTWQPQDGVRLAAVLKPVGDKAFVLAGKSLKETDKRVQTLGVFTLIGWAVSIVLALLLTLAIKPKQSLAIIEETNVTVVEQPTTENE